MASVADAAGGGPPTKGFDDYYEAVVVPGDDDHSAAASLEEGKVEAQLVDVDLGPDKNTNNGNDVSKGMDMVPVVEKTGKGGGGGGKNDPAAMKDDSSSGGGGGKDKGKTAMVPILQMFRFANARDRMYIALGVFFSTASGFPMPIFVVLLGNTIDELNGGNIVKSVNKLCILFVIMGLAAFVAGVMQVYFWTRSGEEQANRVRALYVKAILRQDIAWFDANHALELPTKVTANMAKFQDGMGRKLGDAVMYILGSMISLVTAFTMCAPVTGVVLAALPITAGTTALTAKLMSKNTTRGAAFYARAGGVATEVISGIRTIASLTCERAEIARYSALLTGAEQAGIKAGLDTGFGQGLMFSCFYLTYGLAFWFGGTLVAHDMRTDCQHNCYTGGNVISAVFAVLFTGLFLGQSATGVTALFEARATAVDVFATIDRVPEIDCTSEEGKKLDHVDGSIEFRNITFAYPARPDSIVYQNLQLTIPKGKTCALVGPSGGGKSTLAKLVLRFYDPVAGSVRLDGVDIRELNVKWLRQRIGYVGQEPVLFEGSIKQNIANGKQGCTDEEVANAAKKANAHTFIAAFPKNFDTEVGEGGLQMSGGQKQRIAIARAIIKDPAILILDESTSALDSQSERVVQQALDDLRHSASFTTLVIAHRLSTIKEADVIAVISNKQISELGTHDELLGLGGLYATLCRTWEEKEAAEADGDGGSVVSGSGSGSESSYTNDEIGDSGLGGGGGGGDSAGAAGGGGGGSSGAYGEGVVVGGGDDVLAVAVPVDGQPLAGGDGQPLGGGGGGGGIAGEGGEGVKAEGEGTLVVVPTLSDKVEGSHTHAHRQHSGEHTHTHRHHSHSHEGEHTHSHRQHSHAHSSHAERQHSHAHSTHTHEDWRKQSTAGGEEEEVDRDAVTDEDRARVPSSRLWKMNAPEKKHIYMGWVGALLAGSCFPLEGVLISQIQVAFYKDTPHEVENGVGNLAVLFIALAGVGIIGHVALDYGMAYSGEKLTHRLRDLSLTAILRHDVGWFDSEDHSTGLLTIRLESDAAKVQKATGRDIAHKVQLVFTLCVGLVIGLIACWQVALIAIACIPLIASGAIISLMVLTGKYGDNDGLDGGNQAGRLLGSALSAMTTVSAYNMQGPLANEYGQLVGKVSKEREKRAFIAGLAFGYAQSIILFVFGLLFFVGGQFISKGIASFSGYFTAMFAIIVGAFGVGQITGDVGDHDDGMKAAARLFRLIDDDLKIDPLSEQGSTFPVTDSTSMNITFQDISFAYPERADVQIYNKMNLEVKAGKTVALCGPSGCGKSTCLALLMRFYDPLGGAVLLNGRDVRELNVKWLRTQIGYVGQEPVMFSGTIRENILRGKVDATTEEIEAAARSAHAHDFITSFALGYETDMGEKSALLSGGQKQRVAIARALIKNPSILLLDEASSALDNESEKQVQLALNSLQEQRGRTTIVVAHRLSTIKDADAIAVFAHGVVSEIGTHNELLVNTEGIYAQLWQQQNLGATTAA